MSILLFQSERSQLHSLTALVSHTVLSTTHHLKAQEILAMQKTSTSLQRKKRSIGSVSVLDKMFFKYAFSPLQTFKKDFWE